MFHRRRIRALAGGGLALALVLVALWPAQELKRDRVTRREEDDDRDHLDDAASDERPLHDAAELPEVLPRRASRPPPSRRAPLESIDESIEPEPQPEDPSPEAYPDEFFTPLPPPDLPVWAYDGAVPGPEPAPTSIARRFDEGAPTRVVERDLRERDAPLGLDLPGAGLIATLLAEAVRGETPARSSATFVARIASDGEVLSIDVVSYSSGEHAVWRAAADQVSARIVGTLLPLPGYLASGAVVTLRVIQNMELPSGTGRRGEERAPTFMDYMQSGIPRPGRLARTEEPVVPIADMLPPDLQNLGNPETMVPPKNADGSGGGLTCRLTFDLVDIGAHEERVVKVQLSVVPSDPAPGPRAEPSE